MGLHSLKGQRCITIHVHIEEVYNMAQKYSRRSWKHVIAHHVNGYVIYYKLYGTSKHVCSRTVGGRDL